MSLSIGTLVGYLQLDDSNFNRKADNADRKLNALKLHLQALKRENPHISVEVDAQTAKIDELKVKIADLKTQAAAGADVRVDIVQAMVDLDRVQSKVRELHGKTIKVDVDDRSATAKLDGLAKKTNGLSWLMTGVLTLGPSLIPITAAAGGLVAALGAPIAAAGGGGTLYALIAGQAVKQTEKQATAIAALKKKVDAAQVSLNKASTASGKKSAAATLAADTAAYDAALAKLNPQQQAFLKAQAAMGKSFTTLLRTAGPSVFGPMTLGMDLLAKDMPKVAPVLKSVSGALTDLMRELAHSGALDSFIGFLAKFSGPTIRSAGHILGDLALGAGGLMKAFLPLSMGLEHGLEHMAAGFAAFGKGASSNSGVQAFISYVEKVGPHVVATIGDIVKALVHIGASLAPLGNLSLGALDLLAKIIDKIPPHLLREVAGGFVLIAGGMKAIATWKAAKGGLDGLMKAMATEKVASFAAHLGGVGTAIMAISTRLAGSRLAMGSAIAGMAGLAVAAQSSNKLINILGDSASGALLGFGLGGPIGAAIGGGAGALLGLGQAAFQAGNAVDSASGKTVAALNAQNHAMVQTDVAANAVRLGALRQGFLLTAQGATAARNSVTGLTQAFNALNGHINAQASMDAFHSALLAFNDALKQNGKSLNDNTSRGLANRAALRDIASSALTAAQDLKGLDRLRFMDTARKDLIRAAVQAGATEQAARRLANQWLGLSNLTARPKLRVDIAQGLAEIDFFKAQLVAATSPRTVQIHVNRVNNATHGGASTAGGVIPKHATGGLLTGPGTGTSDSIPILGSNGEFMISAAAVKRYGVGLFQDLNAMRLATGGSVSNSPSHQRALARARQNLRRTRLEIELKDAQTKLQKYNQILSQADAFASAFAPNVFAAGLPTTKDITVPGGVSTQVINGQVVTSRGAGTTKTVNLSNKQILADMLKYAQQQKAQDAQLAKNIKKLKSEGLSKNIIEQMQAAGPAGIAQINALASGTKAQVKQFNALNSAAQNSLNEAGAQGVARQRYQKLENQAAQEQTIVKGVQKALKNMKLQVAGGNLRLV